MPEPSPLVHVTAQARPSPSSTEMCVVEPSCEAMNSSRKPGRSRPSMNSGVRARCASSIAATSRPWVGGAGSRSSWASTEAIRIPPADGGGLVKTS